MLQMDLFSLLRVRLTEFPGRFAHDVLKCCSEFAGVGIAAHFSDLTDGTIRVDQQLRRRLMRQLHLELKAISPVFEEDIYDAISMETCVNKRLTIGAPGKEAMEQVIALEKAYLMESPAIVK